MQVRLSIYVAKPVVTGEKPMMDTILRQLMVDSGTLLLDFSMIFVEANGLAARNNILGNSIVRLVSGYPIWTFWFDSVAIVR
jgi:hypothetical protein